MVDHALREHRPGERPIDPEEIRTRYLLRCGCVPGTDDQVLAPGILLDISGEDFFDYEIIYPPAGRFYVQPGSSRLLNMSDEERRLHLEARRIREQAWRDTKWLRLLREEFGAARERIEQRRED